jgi:hypothetical protein
VAASAIVTTPVNDNSVSSVSAQSVGGEYLYVANDKDDIEVRYPGNGTLIGNISFHAIKIDQYDSGKIVAVNGTHVAEIEGRSVTSVTKYKSTTRLDDIAIDNATGDLYATSYNNLYGLDGSDYSVKWNITNPQGPNTISFDSHNDKLYRSLDGSVEQIDPATGNIDHSRSLSDDVSYTQHYPSNGKTYSVMRSTYVSILDNGLNYQGSIGVTPQYAEWGALDANTGAIFGAGSNGNVFKADLDTETESWSVSAYQQTTIGDVELDRDKQYVYIATRDDGIVKLDYSGNNVYTQSLSGNPQDVTLIEESSTSGGTQTDPNLEIDTRSYLKHGNSSDYAVYYTNSSGDTIDISNDSGLNISSSNTTVITLDTTANTVTATSNESINARENITANYSGMTQKHNVTVANATVDNLEILPGVTRVEATYTDSNIVLILIATMLGVVATRASSAFAGIATIQLVLVTGFFVDLISLGVVLVGLFGALFIGLNLAANIDYTVRG